MLGYISKRLGLAVLVALTVSIIAYMLLYLSGDPALAIAGEGARQADIDIRGWPSHAQLLFCANSDHAVFNFLALAPGFRQ
jgi:ABC-type dipeptide/oligopeptide/nickel transport system permease component